MSSVAEKNMPDLTVCHQWQKRHARFDSMSSMTEMACHIWQCAINDWNGMSDFGSMSSIAEMTCQIWQCVISGWNDMPDRAIWHQRLTWYVRSGSMLSLLNWLTRFSNNYVIGGQVNVLDLIWQHVISDWNDMPDLATWNYMFDLAICHQWLK